MEFEQLLRLVETVAASGLNEFDYEQNGLKLHLGKKAPKTVNVSGAGAANIPVEEIPVTMQAVQTPAEASAKTGTEVISPIVGVFYAAPSPEAEPFVKVGDRVEAGQVIGSVEAMKLMNEIESDVSGIVVEICVQNGDGVEYGQPLIRVQE